MLRSAESHETSAPSASPAALEPPPDDPDATATSVLVLNHRRDPLDGVVQALRRAGYRTTECRSLADSQRELQRGAPDVLILDPVVVKPGGVELGLAEAAQQAGRPVPVLLVLDDLAQLDAVDGMRAVIRDFVLRPVVADEVVHRVATALRTRAALLALHARTRELEDRASTDPKTGLLTDGSFRQTLQIEFKRALRHQTPLSMLWIDIDDFKSINDSTSYAFGDAVLQRVAETLRDGIRETDHAARFGGDEFMLMLPHTTPAEAVQTAIRIRKKIAQLVVHEHGFSRAVTLSIGIDTYGGRSESTPDELRARANKALHVAKRRGKNQVWLYDADDPDGREGEAAASG